MNTQQTLRPVEIHDLDTDSKYIARTETDCRDGTDRSVFREVIKRNDLVTMGHITGIPMPIRFTGNNNGNVFTSTDAPAQAQPPKYAASHSSLPWTALSNSIVTIGIPGKGAIATLRETPCEGGLHLSPEIAEANAAYIVRACNNAQRLADALKAITRELSWISNPGTDALAALNDARAALADWNEAQ